MGCAAAGACRPIGLWSLWAARRARDRAPSPATGQIAERAPYTIYGSSAFLAIRKPRLTSSSLPSKLRSSCSMLITKS